MRKQTKILNVPFDVVTMEEAVSNVLEFFKGDKPSIICTPNPEIVMLAQEDLELMEILENSHMVIPDGIGVVWASKYTGVSLPERVAGFDLTQNLFSHLSNDPKNNKSFYFFGGGEGVAEKAKIKMKEKYPNINIVGTRSGYFSLEDEEAIIEDINSKNPDVLLVGLGAPKQEKWIYKNIDKLNVKVAIGVGGSFDVMAGVVKRAPVLFQKLHLEWFYRLITQPTRCKRMLQLPIFVMKVKKEYK